MFELTDVFERGVGEVTDIVEKELFRLAPRTEEAEALGAPARADRRDRPGLRPARDADLAAAGEAHRDRARCSATTGRRRAATASSGSSTSRPSAMPGRRSTPRSSSSGWRFYRDAGLAGVEVLLNSIGDAACRPAYVEELTAYYRAVHRPAARARADAARAQRAAPARFEGPGDGRAQRRGAEDHRPAVRRLRRAFRGRPGAPRRARGRRTGSSRASSAASTTTRGPRSSSTSPVARASSRPSAAGAATTASSSCSVAGRRRASGSGSGSIGSSSPSTRPV